MDQQNTVLRKITIYFRFVGVAGIIYVLLLIYGIFSNILSMYLRYRFWRGEYHGYYDFSMSFSFSEIVHRALSGFSYPYYSFIWLAVCWASFLLSAHYVKYKNKLFLYFAFVQIIMSFILMYYASSPFISTFHQLGILFYGVFIIYTFITLLNFYKVRKDFI